MNIRPPVEASRSELSVVPLVNVVFLLLVFFMLVGQVVSPEPLRVEPPRAESGLEAAGQTVRLLIARDGAMALDREIIAPADLDRKVAAILERRPGASFQIKADGRADGVALIRVMEQLRDAGVERITLLTERAARG